MPANDYRLLQISASDLSPGSSMFATFTPKRSIQVDNIDGDEARGQSVSVLMSTQERQAIKDIFDRATARMDFRRAGKAINPLLDLSTPQVGEP